MFYDGVNQTTGHLLNYQGPLTKKAPTIIKQLIEKFCKNSRQYHNCRDDKTRGYKDGIGGSEDLSAVMDKLELINRRMTKMDQSIHAIQVGCDNYGGPHLTKECDLNENGSKKV